MKDSLNDIIAKYHASGIEQLPNFNRLWTRILILHSAALSENTTPAEPNYMSFDPKANDENQAETMTVISLARAYKKMEEYARNHVDIDINKLCVLAGIVNSDDLNESEEPSCDFRKHELPEGPDGLSHAPAKNIGNLVRHLCNDINEYRRQISLKSTIDYYYFTFDIQRMLMYISPWTSGNARMARLVTNWMQCEYGLLPTRVDANDSKSYIGAYRDSILHNNPDLFRSYLSETMCVHLSDDLKAFSVYVQSLPKPVKKAEPKKKRAYIHTPLIINPLKTRGKILQLLLDNPKLSAAAISKIIGVSTKGIERHFSRLKHDGYLRRIGPDKGGHWEVVFTGDANQENTQY